MRGKQAHLQQKTDIRRITPACAGKTQRVMDAYEGTADHPRVCGENGELKDDGSIQRGSPPRVRGKHHMNVFQLLALRITPACAGKTGCE